MRNMAKGQRPQVPAEQAFVVTVGVSEDRYVDDCARALAVLRDAGYQAAPTKHDTFDLVAADKDILPQLREIGEQHDPPPAAA